MKTRWLSIRGWTAIFGPQGMDDLFEKANSGDERAEEAYRAINRQVEKLEAGLVLCIFCSVPLRELNQVSAFVVGHSETKERPHGVSCIVCGTCMGKYRAPDDLIEAVIAKIKRESKANLN